MEYDIKWQNIKNTFLIFIKHSPSFNKPQNLNSLYTSSFMTQENLIFVQKTAHLSFIIFNPMEEYGFRWRTMHQSAKNHGGSKKSSSSRFRSKSRNKDQLRSQRPTSSRLSKLISHNHQRKNTVGQLECHDQGKQNQKGLGDRQEVRKIKMQLSKLGSTTQNRQIIESTISLIQQYQHRIERLQEKSELSKKLNDFASSGSCCIETPNNSQVKNGVECLRLKSKASTNITNYYFPMYQ